MENKAVDGDDTGLAAAHVHAGVKAQRIPSVSWRVRMPWMSSLQAASLDESRCLLPRRPRCWPRVVRRAPGVPRHPQGNLEACFV